VVGVASVVESRSRAMIRFSPLAAFCWWYRRKKPSRPFSSCDGSESALFSTSFPFSPSCEGLFEFDSGVSLLSEGVAKDRVHRGTMEVSGKGRERVGTVTVLLLVVTSESLRL
jgi:hypothetical protein